MGVGEGDGGVDIHAHQQRGRHGTARAQTGMLLIVQQLSQINIEHSFGPFDLLLERFVFLLELRKLLRLRERRRGRG